MFDNSRYLNPHITSKYRILEDPEDPRLHVVSKTVGDPTSLKTQEIIQALVGYANTMPNCAGLAASQIGVNRRIFIVKHNNEWVPMVNARIVEHSEEKIWGPEGCMSHAGVTADVARYAWIRVVAYDAQTGKEWRLKFYHNQDLHNSGYYPQLYRVIQHELDHDNGVLFTDKGADTKNYIVHPDRMKRQMEAHVEAEEAGPVEVDI
jgi:peptide deformylase